MQSQNSTKAQQGEAQKKPANLLALEALDAQRKAYRSTIAKHSKLDQVIESKESKTESEEQKLFNAFSQLDSEQADHLFVAINAEGQAELTGFEGNKRTTVTGWCNNVMAFLKSFKNTEDEHLFLTNQETLNQYSEAVLAIKSLNTSAEEITKLEHAGSDLIEEYADKVMQEIIGLKENFSYCMAGGYGGKKGHAMIYRFKKNGDGTFNIYIYNAQGGNSIQDQGGKYDENGLPISKPCLVLEKVTEKELFFTSDAFKSSAVLKRLVMLTNDQDDKVEHDDKEIRTILYRCMHHLVPSEKLPQLFLEVQRSGNCAFKSVNCLLLEIMGKIDKADSTEDEYEEGSKDFRRLMTDAKMCSLLAFYNKYIHDQDQDKQNLQYNYMLEKATENFLKQLEKNKQKNIITENESLSLVATANHILKNVKHNIQKAYEQESDEKIDPAISNDEIAQQSEKRAEGFNQYKKLSAEQKQDNNVPNKFIINSLLGADESLSWKDLKNVLQEMKVILTNRWLKNVELNQYENSIIKIFMNLRAKKMDDLSSQELQDIQKLLYETFYLYTRRIDSGTNRQQELPSINACMATEAISYLIALKLNPELADYGLYMANFEKAIANPAAMCTSDRVFLKEYEELVNFYKLHNKDKKAILFNYESGRLNADKKETPEIALYNSILGERQCDCYCVDKIEKCSSVISFANIYIDTTENTLGKQGIEDLYVDAIKSALDKQGVKEDAYVVRWLDERSTIRKSGNIPKKRAILYRYYKGTVIKINVNIEAGDNVKLSQLLLGGAVDTKIDNSICDEICAREAVYKPSPVIQNKLRQSQHDAYLLAQAADNSYLLWYYNWENDKIEQVLDPKPEIIEAYIKEKPLILHQDGTNFITCSIPPELKKCIDKNKNIIEIADDKDQKLMKLFTSMSYADYPASIRGLLYLKKISLMAFVGTTHRGKEARIVSSRDDKITIKEDNTISYAQGGLEWDTSNFVYDIGETLNQGIGIEKEKYLNNQYSHNMEEVRSENYLKCKPNSAEETSEDLDKILTAMDCALTNPEVQTSVLLSCIENHMQLLQESCDSTNIISLLSVHVKKY